jgi:CheY-like chemotaxis protein
MNSSLWALETDISQILVVDDLPDNCLLLQTFLEIEGYQVETANSGQVALEKIAFDPPDLILLDVMMPGMSGFEVVRYIRQNPALCLIPILLVTGYDESVTDNGLEVGANGLIRKPVDLEFLISQVRKFLPSKD